MTSTAQTIRFTSDRERKAYQDGLAIVARKLAGCTRPTADELHAAAIADGRAQVLKKLGSAAYWKCFNSDPPKTMAPATTATRTTAANRKSYESGEYSPRKLHRYDCRNWLPATV